MSLFAPLNNCFLYLITLAPAGMHNVRRFELEKETQNKPIKWIVCWVFSLISFSPRFFSFLLLLSTNAFFIWLLKFSNNFFSPPSNSIFVRYQNMQKNVCRNEISSIESRNARKKWNKNTRNEIMCEVSIYVMTIEMFRRGSQVARRWKPKKKWNNETAERKMLRRIWDVSCDK